MTLGKLLHILLAALVKWRHEQRFPGSGDSAHDLMADFAHRSVKYKCSFNASSPGTSPGSSQPQNQKQSLLYNIFSVVS